jgi:hypothetical protein
MCDQIMDYKSYRIVPKPTASGTDEIWFGGYEISKDGRTISSRTHIYPGFPYFKAACIDSIEHAKIEVDNLIAAT